MDRCSFDIDGIGNTTLSDEITKFSDSFERLAGFESTLDRLQRQTSPQTMDVDVDLYDMSGSGRVEGWVTVTLEYQI